ncbi:Tellurite resistance methyltransferase, TehB, core [Ectocarpus siliculosus]|uniref:Tellurite resistance methyltransferase, TehB, core n=1 Tax=Ectocarpus siliculosus TaxID=2880 RepID=D7FQG6_ECTSI|nr:Tellurite resistance methyltransferase, TehB, core [Ectocarpus siliculosus]|eukprot:CBJ48498.1 Tellurite resistance methyltransferase, TehB, core [Ectocarpus siliculosus]
MGAARSTPTLLHRCLSLLLLLLLQMQMGMVCCFVVPPHPSGGIPSIETSNSIRPLPTTATSYTTVVAASRAGAEATSCTTAIVAGTAADDSIKSQTRTTPCAGAAGASPDPFATRSEFQEFVGRRKSGSRRVVLDLRPRADFRREHLEGSTSIPVDELEPRLLELPPPFAQPVNIVGSQQELRTARDFLTNKGWQIEEEVDLSVAACTKDPAHPTEAWPTETGSTSLQVWRANDFLEFCMDRFVLPSGHDASPFPGKGLVLDLGCGSGRDTVYMAQRLPPGTRVVGVDNHSYALERGARLAERWLEDTSSGEVAGGSGGGGGSEQGATRSQQETQTGCLGGVTSGAVGRSDTDGSEGATKGNPPEVRQRACEWSLADLRKEGSLDGMRASIVHGHRFKCERLLPLLRDHVLLPGGYFIWSTFLDTGSENLVPPWRPSRMMRPGELADIFSGDGFEILVDEQGELPTRGSTVPANFFACRKRLATPTKEY